MKTALRRNIAQMPPPTLTGSGRVRVHAHGTLETKETCPVMVIHDEVTSTFCACSTDFQQWLYKRISVVSSSVHTL